MTTADDQWLARAIELARSNVDEGGGPFGAVITKNDALLAQGINRVTRDNDPSAHAEVQAVREACRRLGTFELAGATLYTSCEPCPMCMATALWARLDRVVYAADRDDAARGGFDDGTFYELFSKPRSEWPTPVEPVPQHDGFAPFQAWLDRVDRVDY